MDKPISPWPEHRSGAFCTEVLWTARLTDISVTEHAGTPHGACNLVNHRLDKLDGFSGVCRRCLEINCSKKATQIKEFLGSLRERFHLAEDKAAIASQVIAATIEAGLVKADESVGGSRKFARYVPFWA